MKPSYFFYLLLLISTKLSAQQQPPVNEPNHNLAAAFSSIADSIPVTIQKLEAAFNGTIGEEMSLELSPGFILDGKIIANTSKYGGAIQSFNFKPNFRSNMLVIGTRTKLPSGETSYSCHITGKEVIDAFYMIKKNGYFYFIKKNIHTLRAE